MMKYITGLHQNLNFDEEINFDEEKLYEEKKTNHKMGGKMKKIGQTTKWEKILGDHTSDKGHIFRIYEDCIQPNDRKTTTQFKKWVKDPNRHSNDIQMAHNILTKDAQLH